MNGNQKTLTLAIADAIRGSECTPREVVDVLLTIAAGRAVTSKTHDDCHDFHQCAHDRYHTAEAVEGNEEGVVGGPTNAN